MREITPQLTLELERHIGDQKVPRSDPFSVDRFSQLMRHIAQLAFANKDYLLFFRGQSRDYQNRARGSTFYPSIYRGDQVPKDEIKLRFARLANAEKQLIKLSNELDSISRREVQRRRYVRWSILQHYEVCATPLLDVTHTAQVACSFAQLDNDGDGAHVFVFGLPYIGNRIAINSEHEIINVRLLSICPPDALRPYFQDGYVVGTDDVTDDYDSKTELDFSRRLIAKFAIPNSDAFWDEGFSKVPKEVLYPVNDKMRDLCKRSVPEITPESGQTAIGNFLTAWIALETLIVQIASRSEDRIPTIVEAIKRLRRLERIDGEFERALHSLRQVRNRIVHGTSTLEPREVAHFTEIAAAAHEKLLPFKPEKLQ
jgi:hypothetical protein